jgi:ABC-type sugar transport system permease subunit
MRRRGLGRAWPWLSVPFLVFLTLPLAALLLRAEPADIWANLGRREVQQAIGLSLSTSLWASGLAAVFGTPLAYLLARRSFRFRRVLDAFVELPMVLPPAVAGVALLMAFGRRGLLGPTLALLGITLGYWVPAKGALPVANVLYLLIAYGGGLWTGPRLPAAAERVSPLLPTRQWADLLWPAVSGRPWHASSWLALLGFACAFAGLAAWGYRRDEGRRWR